MRMEEHELFLTFMSVWIRLGEEKRDASRQMS